MDECSKNYHFLCNSSRKCIHYHRVCDSNSDCIGGEDEAAGVCTMRKCLRHGGFLCNISQKCIPYSRVCDGYKDCVDGEDESPPACNLKQVCESNRSWDGCLGQCKPGFFGNYCGKHCSEHCLNEICDKSSGICKDCTQTYLENCSLECAQGCREKEGFPTCDRQSGKCLHGCNHYHYGDFCNNTCKHCKGNSSDASCDINGVCLYGCENGYWDKKCSSKCSANCEGDEQGNRCNSSTGECINGCTRGWRGLFCGALEKQCESKLSATEGCLGRCSPGYFGKFCGQNCSENCLDGICNKSSGICKDCTRRYLENCSIKCGQGCREKEGFPQCDRQSGKCLYGCYLYHYGDFCNKTCKHCKGNSSNASCDINGVCQYGCENGYWDEKCSSKCSTNCEGDAYENWCNSSTGECFNGCIPGWSDVSNRQTVTLDTDNLKTALILAIFSVVSVVVGIICYLKTRKRFNRQQNERIEPCQVFSVGVQPGQQLSESLRRQNLDLYADINEETMEQYRYFGEQNSPDHYDEINSTISDYHTGNVPSDECTDDSNSLQSISKSEDKTGLDSTDETRSRHSATHYYSELDHACNTDNMNGVNPRSSVVESYSSIERMCTKDHMDLETLCQTNKAEDRLKSATRESDEGEEIFGDLGQFHVDYIHAIASDECELLSNELESSL
ncbi:cell death abnormality protein 1-like [Mya arenaria]|uniref:cell death abnormality protein 1-like n=1 Tax=Mya arenaria TaxID=6604 RepID=UPI0022E948BB|nr:cell death abnormality protein 1-like [Mya arenaria]